MPRAFLEVSPLFESHWTGIPVVAAGLVQCALADPGLDWGFLYENVVIDPLVVTDMLRLRRGSQFFPHLEQQLWNGDVLSPGQMAEAACIFTNLKALRRQFAREALVVHDISTLLTPEFHNTDTVRHHANRLRGDVASTDFFFCVSRATMMDLHSYFGVPLAAAAVIPVGMSVDPCMLTTLLIERAGMSCEPYVCVLGTVEPRKNGGIVLAFLRDNPNMLDKYRFVFIGRDGWNDEKRRMLDELDRLGLPTSRIVFTGFVPEETKMRLVLSSRFCIYPSFFEGYGIPIAEAAALGKYVVCSNSSSMTEVAPEMCFFFDPTDLLAFADAFFKAELAADLTWLDRLGFADIAARLEARDWRRAYDTIRSWVVEGTPA
jgi:glycosyltransferase involved in cell wall biosynthesis